MGRVTAEWRLILSYLALAILPLKGGSRQP
jgi:hypothetical protein